MNDTSSHISNPQGDRGRASELDRLISRFIDGETDAADIKRLRQLAERDPSLWRRVAEDQQRMLGLMRSVEPELERLAAVDLPPANSIAASHDSRQWLRGASIWSGWAAALLLALIVAMMTVFPPQRSPSPSSTIPAGGEREAPTELSAVDHYRAYLGSPFVIGELDAVMLAAEEMDDGTIIVRIVRRIEEAYRVDRELVPFDDRGRLVTEPGELMPRATPVGRSAE